MDKRFLSPQRGFFPQPCYIIGTMKEDDTADFALVTFITFCSVEPPMLMFTLRGSKLTRELVEKNKTFSSNLVTEAMMEMADYFGTASGYKHDKAKEAEAAYTLGKQCFVPILEDSPWVYECELSDTKNVGDGTIYIGKICGIHVSDRISDISYGKIDMQQVNPLIYAPGQYYRISEGIGKVGLSQKQEKQETGK